MPFWIFSVVAFGHMMWALHVAGGPTVFSPEALENLHCIDHPYMHMCAYACTWKILHKGIGPKPPAQHKQDLVSWQRSTFPSPSIPWDTHNSCGRFATSHIYVYIHIRTLMINVHKYISMRYIYIRVYMRAIIQLLVSHLMCPI